VAYEQEKEIGHVKAAEHAALLARLEAGRSYQRNYCTWRASAPSGKTKTPHRMPRSRDSPTSGPHTVVQSGAAMPRGTRWRAAHPRHGPRSARRAVLVRCDPAGRGRAKRPAPGLRDHLKPGDYATASHGTSEVVLPR
jgi:hypothetical protein